MTNEELLKVIEQAARDRVTRLDLSRNRLTSLPAEIGRLTNLTWLNLDNNQLTSLPLEIGQLTNLTQLDLSNNQLTSLPLKIGQLTNLTQLYLSNNQLTSLPLEIGQLTSLTQLYLSYNQLTSLPLEIGQLTSLTQLDLSYNQLTSLLSEIKQLTRLTWLNLRNNQLTSLPPEIKQLTRLTWLNLSYNQLTSLLPEIGQLTSLTELDLSNNELEQLPPEIAQLNNITTLYILKNRLISLPQEIAQLNCLQKLSLARNQLTTLPPAIAQLNNLEVLYLDGNRLTTLPLEIKKLTRLTYLDLRGNLLPNPPEILEKTDEPATIINYYLGLQQGQKKPLNEAKMLLVGQGSVGKTSLVKRLVDDTYNPHENKTEGINIQPWQIQVNNQDIQLNIWDFGGQEIMHATHQFFLTKRSLYLLVLDARLGEQENRLDYWLKIIQSFGGDSPVIIVGNKIDQHPLDIDRRGLENKYPNIKAILETSCQNKIGIDNLHQVIITEISQLNHIHDPLLLSGFNVKKQLEKMDRDYIPYTDYEKMCQDEGITDGLSQRTLIGFLHDLGVVLNFQDEPRLEETNILNPEWVTNGVYEILNDNLLLTQYQGILEREQLNRILDPQKYPKNKHLFIIDMMRKFELCFDLETDKKFLIPDLLPKEEPDTGEWDNSLGFQYHYPVLPSSIISRFIVRMNHRISKNTYWRSGVVLANHENRALVKADREDKKIFILIKGAERTRRDFLTRIRDNFEAIHKTIPGIQAEEKVALPTHPDIVVDYKYLLDLEELGERDFIPPGLKEKVNIKELLDGIESEEKRKERQGKDNIDEKSLNSISTDEPSSKASKDKFNWVLFWTAIGVIVALMAAIIGQGGITGFIDWVKKNQTPSPSQTPNTSPKSNNNSTPLHSHSPDPKLNKNSTSSPK